MNDRFKFRFWREHYDGKFTLECADLMSIDGSAEPYNVGEGDVYCYYPGETIIEQCTGLKDKNGKLIYEGDILYCMLNCPRKGVVEFYRNAFCLNENGSYSEDIIFSDKCCEVIGNVHENPELLK